jgi:hypothetical protein
MRALIAIIFSSYSLLSLAATTDTEYYSYIDSLSYSQAAPIEQMIHDLGGTPLKSGKFAFTHNQFEVGLRKKDFEFSYFYRYDYYLKFNNDTAQLSYLLKNDIPLPKNKRYKVYLQANHLRAWGLAIAKQIEVSDTASVKARLNYLQADKTTDGYLKGYLQSLDDGYQTQLYLDYGYSRDTLLKRHEEPTEGHGLSLDIDIIWQATDKIKLSLLGRDIASYIKYRDLTYTQANANTDTISYNQNGAIDAKPTVSGIERNRNQSQKLPSRLELIGEYSLTQQDGITAELFSYDYQLFPRIGYTQKKPAYYWRLDYDLRTQALGIGIGRQNISFSLRSDSLKLEAAQVVEISIIGTYYFN